MSESKQSVFISSSLADRSWVQAFARSLEQLGQKVGTDVDGGNSDESADLLEKRLRESNLVVLLVTPANLNVPYLFFEIGAALGMGKPVVLLRSEDLDIGKLPLALRKHKLLLKGSPEATAEELVQGMAA